MKCFSISSIFRNFSLDIKYHLTTKLLIKWLFLSYFESIGVKEYFRGIFSIFLKEKVFSSKYFF